MSKIEVNTVEPQCGTNLTIGASGDTITFPSGTTVVNNGSQTGFGRTGTVNWVTTVKTTGFTAVSGEGYFCNTAGGAFTLTLPSSPSAGDIVGLKDYNGNFATANLTIGRGGSPINGANAADPVISTAGASIFLVYVDASQGWVATQDDSSTFTGESFICASVSGACNTLVTAPCCANTKIATFKGPGTFTVNQAASCASNNLVSYLIVAGGSGGGYDRAGGGGAGGFREVKSPVTPYTASPLDGYGTPGNRVTVTAQGYAVVVGAGSGAGTGPSRPPNGSDSSFGGITAAGGGGAGSPGATSGNPGGSGGGARDIAASGGNGNDPATTPAQGQNGGSSTGNQSGPGGGGGGALQTGFDGQGNPSVPTMGDGGDGASTLINPATGEGGPGPSQYYAGGGGSGGGGSVTAGGEGGLGGGGNGAGNSGPASVAGIANTGGGGGAGNGGTCGFQNGAAGGSGIVIIRYKFQ
jgi:hypothetical protein